MRRKQQDKMERTLTVYQTVKDMMGLVIPPNIHANCLGALEQVIEILRQELRKDKK